MAREASQGFRCDYFFFFSCGGGPVAVAVAIAIAIAETAQTHQRAVSLNWYWRAKALSPPPLWFAFAHLPSTNQLASLNHHPSNCLLAG